jgi:hypothetical protein
MEESIHPTLNKSITIKVFWPSSGVLHVSFSAPLRGDLVDFHDSEGVLTVPDRPTITIGDLIVVGSGIRAVVAWVRDRGAPLGDCVAMYLDKAKKARYANVQWTGTQWAFVREPPSGHDANEVPALRPLIRKLRRVGL